ncbi:MAG: 2,3-bisphosphoglycerate-independent phosphoglycerate mutase [Candidatus Korarchaeota archaeon NZ13-K]|nr:MAG: 2,3-bisphosphoglycerate-independent phosphoglycerate mutase [Candidatus Korarchaeota archaeon NZ13-K]
MRRVLLLIIDGIGDRPCPSLRWLTPLQAADIPNMDLMAAKGILGMMHPIAPGVPPGSDSGHLSIFGYDLEREYPGRGAFEALSEGIEWEGITFRANFATVREENGKLIVVDRRAGRIDGEDASSLASELREVHLLNGEVKARFIHTLEHRGFLLLQGEGLSSRVTDVDPHEEGYYVLEPKPIEESAARTAEAVKEFLRVSYEILRDHEVNRRRVVEGKRPANFILLRGASGPVKLEPFSARWGFRPAAVAAGPMYKGIARALGFEVFHPQGATGLPNSDFSAKVSKALDLLDEFDFVYVHMKGTDVASHNRDPELKVKVLERIDTAMEPLTDPPEDLLIVVTGDHATPCSLGKHSGDPVPVLFYGKGLPRDDSSNFHELDAQVGGLGWFSGSSMMQLILNYSDRALEYGLRPLPEARAFIPKMEMLSPLLF